MNKNTKEEAKKVFSLFSDNIKNYIYEEGWNDLREIQVEAANEIFFTDHDLVISSGTATGKTEAAFFPILSLMEKEKDRPFQILYISPIKALINDQFHRLSQILKESDVGVHRYHGDVSQSGKEAFFHAPRGILQITPESLESLLLRRWNEISSIFSNLRFIVIDEIHAMMSTDRGNQILCLLKRMESAIGIRPRRIGLSATISSDDATARWLCCEEKECRVIRLPKENESLKVGLEHFTEEKKDSPGEADEWIYRATKGIKSIVFSNSREETEKITENLKKIAREKGEEDRFYIHHGNLSAALRKEAEEKLNKSEKAVTVLATSTLEYGIDIEKLKRVICQESPLSISSFLQRLGRSGRREAAPEMLLCFREEGKDENCFVADRIPWELLQGIAIIELYRKEKFIEEAEVKSLPASLLFHQTLALLGAEGGKTAPSLARQVLSLPPFRKISKEQLKLLLVHMISEDYLELCENGVLIPGIKGETLLQNYQFLSVFQDKEQFGVYHKNERIGTIATIPLKGESFTLGGKVWEVEDTDMMKKNVFVRPGKTAEKDVFRGNGGLIHPKILEKMREILFSREEFPYLFPGAAKRLDKARIDAEKMGLETEYLFDLGQGEFVLLPFLGSKAFEAFRRIIEKEIAPLIGLSDIKSHSCYALYFHCRKSLVQIKSEIKEYLKQTDLSKAALFSPGERPVFDKYDTFLPNALRLESFARNRLDQKAAILKLNEIFK